ncbi:unnamed protein product [Candida verbasci]|uniref:Meiotic nuclear division protein 1 n=1 Tax=Candida verbasci TaxID=1227364 RepID=A0A9W4TUH4_9ASCO|nr:unnamed protein product [Candida verbasci]
MPPKKGLSQEEKLKLLLDWFQSSHSFYTLKEIESKGAKICKIPSMQVKDLIANLVDEGLVESEKCGIVNLYWSFKYSKQKQLENRAGTLKSEIELKKIEIENLKKEIIEAEKLRSVEDMPNRSEELARLEDFNKLIVELTSQVASKKVFDNLKHDIKAIEFYHDSIEMIVDHYSRKCNLPVKMLKQELNIPLELDDPPPIPEN